MKRFLNQFFLWVILFLGSLVALGVTAQLDPRLEVLLFAEETLWGKTVFRVEDFKGRLNGPDLLILGSSTCHRGIDPRPFQEQAIDAFNLGSCAQSFFNSKHLLEWSIGLDKMPKTVLIDVYPLWWQSNGIESARDLTINNDLAFQWAFQRMAWSTWESQTILMATYFGIKRIFVPHKRQDETKDIYVQGGFTFSNSLACDTPIPCKPEKVSLNSLQQRAFKSIRKTCEEKDIRLILVNPPQLCEEVFDKPEVMAGLPWIEGNHWPLAKVDTLYYDDHHLRGVGAELYSEWLALQVTSLMD